MNIRKLAAYGVCACCYGICRCKIHPSVDSYTRHTAQDHYTSVTSTCSRIGISSDLVILRQLTTHREEGNIFLPWEASSCVLSPEKAKSSVL